MVIVRRRGVYVVDYYEHGGRHRQSFKTRNKALEFVKNGYRENEPEKPSSLVGISLKDAIRKYYETASVNKSADTHRNEKYIFDKLYDFMVDEVGVTHLSGIELIHLDQYRAFLRKDRKASAVNRMFSTYKAFFNKCVDWDFIAKSPSQKLKKMPEDKTDVFLWDDDQLKAVMAALPSWTGDVIYFLAETSARPIEARRLEWRDVDLVAAQVKLKSFKGTGEAVVRRFHLTPSLVEFLKGLRRKTLNHEGLVFVNSKGNAVTRNCLCSVLRETREALGYKDITPYGLRHTYLTKLIEMNVNLRSVQLIAGHARSTTTERYTHVKDKQLQNVVELAAQKRKLKRTGHKPVTKGKNSAAFH